ncbi:MAG TPA: protein translocase subunit SecD [Rubricoccaceae bacterium]|jgi:preprotein translocase subunit SecD
MQGNGLRIAATAAFLLIALYSLLPTFQNARNGSRLAAMDPAAREAYEAANGDDLLATRERALKLGLDLQGGMNVTLEVGTGTLLRELAEGRTDETFETALAAATREAADSREDFVTLFAAAVEEARPDTRLARYFRNTSAGITARSTNAEVETYLRAEVEDALQRAQEIIRQRVDRFGVSEPLIQRQGTSRIAVELPGIDDPERVRNLLRGTAKLEFRLLPEPQVVQASMQRVGQYFADREAGRTTGAAPADTAAAATPAAGATADSSRPAGDTARQRIDVDALTGGTTARTEATPGAAARRSFAEMVQLSPAGAASPVVGLVARTDTSAVRQMLAEPGVRALLPPGVDLLYTASAETSTTDGTEAFQLVAVNERVELGGDVVTDARAEFDTFTNAPEVSITMNGEGASRWRQITSSNVGKPVAVVLDDVVYTFPTINGTIPNGRTQITGSFTRDQVTDIVTILKSGALPAPVNIIGERTIGPSLGAQAVQNGLRSGIIGFLLIGLFVTLYYRVGGIFAVAALLVNLVLLFGVLAGFNATLTLPGIAGIVLTLGMAIDANVLIYERIREELDAGKSMRAAVDAGFEKAFAAIADGNITTFLIGVVLYSFGTGPIQGFAVTLMAGIITSVFSALVVTRLLIDFTLARNGQRRIAFG